MTGLDVVIAAYEAQSTIARAVRSARDVADRVVVVDDGSTDRTGEVARAAGAVVVRQDNAGAAAARDRGLDAVEAPFVLFLDADDTVLAAGVRRSLAMLRESPDLVAVAGRVVLVEPTGRRRVRGAYPGPVTTAGLVRRGVGPWPPAAQVVRVSALLASRAAEPEPVRPRYAEDFETVLRLTLQGAVVQHDEPSCEYRVHVGKASRNAEQALRCKEEVRSRYADHLGVPIVPMTDPEIRAGAAAMRARADLANRRVAALAASGPLALARTLAARSGRRRRSHRRDDRAPLVVAPWFEGGGAQHALVGLLREAGPGTVDVVSVFDGCRNDEPVRDAAREYVRLRAPRGPVGAVVGAARLVPHLRGRPVVFSLMRGSHVVLGLLPAALTRGARRVASFHQLPSTDGADRLARVEDVLARRWTRRCDVVTAPSALAVREIVDRGFAGADVVREEGNVVAASSRGAASNAERHDGRVRLLFAGRLAHQKGLDRLLAWTARSAVPVDLRVAGEGELAGWLRENAGDLGPPHTVTLLGHVDDLAAQLDWCDAVVLPSRFELNPVVVWEAWARGRAVVASDLPVLRDLARRGPVLLADGPEQWAEALREVARADARAALHAAGLRAFAARERGSALGGLLAGGTSLRVVESWPARRNRGHNPFQHLLSEGIERSGARVREFSLRRSPLRPADVWLWHWPDLQFAGTGAVGAWARAAYLVGIARWARRRGTALVWTVHNLGNHEGRNRRAEEWFFRRFVRTLSGAHYLSESSRASALLRYPGLRAVPGTVVPHGHYGDVTERVPREDARSVLGLAPDDTVLAFVGKVRAYKGVPALLEAFRATTEPSLRLLVAGAVEDTASSDALAAAPEDGRLLTTSRRLTEEELATHLGACDLVVLPYEDVTNSGSALLALTHHRPVLVPDVPLFRELREAMGEEWVRLFVGPLTPGLLEKEALLAAEVTATGRPPLDGLDWPVLAARLVDWYRTLDPVRGR
ncbi:glycosyltransferase [Cellulosimicrobium sp. Marseille-Q8652]